MDAVIRVYDERGNVIETHEHKATSKGGRASGSAALLIAKDHYREPSGFCGLYSNPPFRSFLGFKSRTFIRGCCAFFLPVLLFDLVAISFTSFLTHRIHSLRSVFRRLSRNRVESCQVSHSLVFVSGFA